MEWVDSHCHLDALGEAAPHAIVRARAAGVAALITVGTDLETSRRCLEIASQHEGVWATVGLHPHDADQFSQQLLNEVVRLAQAPEVVAIGEVGLDYYRDLSPRPAQRWAFADQVEAAKAADRAVVIHMRNSHEDVFALLSEIGPPDRLVFHCFSGGPAEATRALDLGGYLSFAGNVSYRGAEELRAAARVVPLDRVLVETDSPYLAPIPHRGKANEPAFVALVGAAVAGARERPVEEIARSTTDNARTVFRLGHPRG